MSDLLHSPDHAYRTLLGHVRGLARALDAVTATLPEEGRAEALWRLFHGKGGEIHAKATALFGSNLVSILVGTAIVENREAPYEKALDNALALARTHES